MERYELIEGTAAKFWQWEIRESELVVSFGRIGTKGQESVKAFSSTTDAQKAAMKLVREKVGKGYARIGEAGRATEPPAAAPPPKADAKAAAPKREAASAPPPAEASPAPSAEIAALATKLKRAFQAGDGLWGLEHAIGRRATLRSLFPIAASGLLSPKLLVRLLGELEEHVALASPAELVAVLRQIPKKLEPQGHGLLDNYTTAVDALVIHLAHRGPAELAAAEASLPPNIRRALPWVRQRLGQPTAAPPATLLAEYVENHLRRKWTTEWRVVDGELTSASTSSFESSASLAAHLGPREAFVEMVRARGEADGVGSASREPAHLAVPTSQLAQLLDRLIYQSSYITTILTRRADPPEVLVDALGKLPKDHRALVGNRTAAVAARAFAAAGKPIPAELDAYIDLNAGHFRGEERGLYLEGLRAFPRDRLLARFDRVLASINEEEWVGTAIGLRAHWDEERFLALAGNADVQRSGVRLANAGPNAIGPIASLLRTIPRPRTGAGDWYGPYVELCRALTILLAETEGDIDPAFDQWLTTPPNWASAEWQAVLKRLPQDRRDAVILAAHAEDLADTSFLHLASDAAIDTAIGRIFAERKRLAKHPDSLVFLALGDRATAPLVKHFSGAQNDKDAKRLLDQTELDDATYAALTGGATVPPPVTGSIANGASYLSLVAPHLAASSPAGSLAIRSGRLAFVREAGYPYATTLARSVPVGEHTVTAYYTDPDSDDLDALPTAGLEALMVRFGPGTPARWEEATDERGDIVLTRELVTMALVDAERKGVDLESAHVTETERRMIHGDAIGFLDDGRALVAYVGEVALEHALYWGLDARGNVLCLVAAFELPKG